jgi:hypothetical protein
MGSPNGAARLKSLLPAAPRHKLNRTLPAPSLTFPSNAPSSRLDHNRVRTRQTCAPWPRLPSRGASPPAAIRLTPAIPPASLPCGRQVQPSVGTFCGTTSRSIRFLTPPPTNEFTGTHRTRYAGQRALRLAVAAAGPAPAPAPAPAADAKQQPHWQQALAELGECERGPHATRMRRPCDGAVSAWRAVGRHASAVSAWRVATRRGRFKPRAPRALSPHVSAAPSALTLVPTDKKEGRKLCVVQTAPAVRVAIAETLGLPPGSVTPGQLVTGLKRLGFDYVFGERGSHSGSGGAACAKGWRPLEPAHARKRLARHAALPRRPPMPGSPVSTCPQIPQTLSPAPQTPSLARTSQSWRRAAS